MQHFEVWRLNGRVLVPGEKNTAILVCSGHQTVTAVLFGLYYCIIVSKTISGNTPHSELCICLSQRTRNGPPLKTEPLYDSQVRNIKTSSDRLSETNTFVVSLRHRHITYDF
jgi:hypothetical protein